MPASALEPVALPVPHTLDLIVQPRLAPRLGLAADRHLLREVGSSSRRRTGALRVYDLAGEVLSLGRYHLAPEPPPAAGVQLSRRHSGGRAMPWGEGFVGLSLALPHRSALLSPEPLALAPEQAMNRYVRGILEACELSGVPAFYPGRDLITVGGRILGLVSFEVDAAGALLFEAILANGRDMSVLPGLLDAADPGGVVKAGMLTPQDTTSFARALGRALTTEEVADRLRRGYERRLGVMFEERAFSEEEARPIVTEFEDDRWLFQRRRRPDLDRHASVVGQLGVLEVYLTLADSCIRDVVVAGDFIANSPAIERLERELRGCAAEASAVEAVVARVFAGPENFILGIGRPATLAHAIAQALAA